MNYSRNCVCRIKLIFLFFFFYQILYLAQHTLAVRSRNQHTIHIHFFATKLRDFRGGRVKALHPADTILSQQSWVRISTAIGVTLKLIGGRITSLQVEIGGRDQAWGPSKTFLRHGFATALGRPGYFLFLNWRILPVGKARKYRVYCRSSNEILLELTSDS